MKTNKWMIASLLILVGMGAITVSCKKEQANARKAGLIIENDREKTGDDEDPVIRIRTKKKNTFVPVGNVLVETMTYGTNTVANSGYTDSNGEDDQQVPEGIYYFRVTVSGSSPVTTDTVHVSKDIQATILVD